MATSLGTNVVVITRVHCTLFILANQNIVVGHCKLHNDASCDIARNGRLLATFVPSHRGFPDDSILAVYSLEPGSRGQCLYTKSFGKDSVVNFNAFMLGSIAQSVACLTADLEISTLKSQLSHITSVAIDHEIISRVFLPLLLIEEGQLSVSGGSMCTSTGLSIVD